MQREDRWAAAWAMVRRDPRWMFAAFLTLFAVLGQVYLGFFQDWQRVTAAIGTAVLMDLALVRLREGRWMIPLSGYITGTGLSLLLSSPAVWPYAAGSALSICSKHFLRFGRRHVYNPNNFGVVVLLVALPALAVSTPKQWTSGLEVMAGIFLLGLLVCWRVGRLDVVLAYGLGFVAMALVRHLVLGTPLLAAVGPLMGASTQLFMFFMITDPKTSPGTREGRIIYGLTIAAVDACIRILRIPNAPFYALFITCTVMAAVTFLPAQLRHSLKAGGRV